MASVNSLGFLPGADELDLYVFLLFVHSKNDPVGAYADSIPIHSAFHFFGSDVVRAEAEIAKLLKNSRLDFRWQFAEVAL